MTNLSIVADCNLNCPYCFSRSAYRGEAAVRSMPARRFDLMLEILVRSGQDRVRLLGGEPTLHAEFPSLAGQVVARGLGLLVFSNGSIPESSLRVLEEIPGLSVMVNIAATMGQNGELPPRQREVLGRLRARVSLAFTICSPNPPLDRLLNLVEEYGLDKSVCLGLAHACLAGGNRFLDPMHYPRVGEQIVLFALRARQERVALNFDCGFVPCMFPSESREVLGKALEEIGTHCGPIPDILPDGDAVACYPLAPLGRLPVSRETTTGDLRKAFAPVLEPYRQVGIYRKCSACDWSREGKCAGGCLADAMRRLRQGGTVFQVPAPARDRITTSRGGDPTAPDATDGSETTARAKWVVPYIDQPLSFWDEIAQDFRDDIKEVYFPLPGDLLGSGRPPQPARHLEDFLARSLLGRSVLINPITLPGPVGQLAPAIIERLRELTGRFQVSSVTVSNPELAERIREALPGLSITASVLMDIAHPRQVLMLHGVLDGLVPSGRIMRNLPALRELRAAFRGRIRLIVNESCIPDCPYRTQHFYEMARCRVVPPGTPCAALLERTPWLRLTGTWVLPQHLHFYRGVYDELKLAGRVTLRNPGDYVRVLRAYTRGDPLSPHEIGGGPASVLDKMLVSEALFAQTLSCSKQCHDCRICRDYYDR